MEIKMFGNFNTCVEFLKASEYDTVFGWNELINPLDELLMRDSYARYTYEQIFVMDAKFPSIYILCTIIELILYSFFENHSEIHLR